MGADTDGALVIHEKPKAHDDNVWRSKLLELRYTNASLAKVILQSYKETSRGKTPRSEEERGCAWLHQVCREPPT